MGKKKEKATESKTEKVEKNKVESFLDNLRPTTGKPEHTRGTGQTKVDSSKPAMTDKTKKAIAGGIVAIAMGAVALVGFNKSGSTVPDAAVQAPAPAAAVTQEAPARAASEAAAASVLPAPLTPQKARLAEPSQGATEVAKPSKAIEKKSSKLANKTKGKEAVKKSTAASKKEKATKKPKKTIAAKTVD